MVTPAIRREAVDLVRQQHELSERRACQALDVGRSLCRYRPRRPAEVMLRERLRHHAAQRPRYGYRRLYVLLRREGLKVNRKRVLRLYRLDALALRRKVRRKLPKRPRGKRPALSRANQRWAMDFVADQLEGRGRRFRTLNVVDEHTRECLAIEVDTSLPGARVVRVLERIAQLRGYPKQLVTDNGPEFISKVLAAWVPAARRAARLHPARQAGGERLRRELQRQVPRRVPQPALVHRPGRCPGDDRRLARRLQYRQATQRARGSRASRFRAPAPPDGHTLCLSGTTFGVRSVRQHPLAAIAAVVLTLKIDLPRCRLGQVRAWT